MDDLQITRLCAEAVGQQVLGIEYGDEYEAIYDPLHDDAQAMALVKKFKLEIDRENSVNPRWMVNFNSRDDNLNRAICLCVAAMQADKCS